MYYDLETLEKIKNPKSKFIALSKEGTEFQETHFGIHNLEEILENTTIRFEDHLNYEVLCLSLDLGSKEKDTTFYLFIYKEGIYLLGNEKYLLDYMQRYKIITKSKKRSIGGFVYQFIMELTQEYAKEINLLINELEVLEDKVLEKEEDEKFSRQILHYRKTLLFCKRKYEHLMDVFDNLLENDKEIYGEREIARFDILKDRTNRILSQIISMLEYVTEIREAYQSEVDHHQNKIMSFLTVISSIFLPLTLIVGWYGMNFMMPEFQSHMSYPLVIILSLAIVIGCIYYFKKKKWF